MNTSTKKGKGLGEYMPLAFAAGIGSMLGSGIIVGLSATIVVWQEGLGLDTTQVGLLSGILTFAIHRRSGISFRLRILTEQPHGMIDFAPRARSTRTVKPTTRRQYVAGDDDELLTIGEVAKLDGITAKALRYYDAHNILKPAAVDPATGYQLPTTDTTPRSNA